MIIEKKKKKVAAARSFNRRMVSMRLREDTIDDIKNLLEKLRKTARVKYSVGNLVEIAVMLANKSEVSDLMNMYAETFKMREV